LEGFVKYRLRFSWVVDAYSEVEAIRRVLRGLLGFWFDELKFVVRCIGGVRFSILFVDLGLEFIVIVDRFRGGFIGDVCNFRLNCNGFIVTFIGYREIDL